MSQAAVIVLPGGCGAALLEVAGLSLVERQLRQLSALGVERITVVATKGESAPVPSKRVSAGLRVLICEESEPWAMLKGVVSELQDRFIVVAGDAVIDERLLDWLMQQDSNCLIQCGCEEPVLLGSLDRASLHAAASPEALHALRVSVDAFPTYWASRRGHVPIHLVRVGNDHDAKRAQRILLDHVDKRTKDLPAVLFDPPFENFLVRVLAPTAITPNQVTLITTALAFFCAWLFSGGRLLAGILLAILVEVLDGVDGKLARIKLMTSRIGELEHVLDFFYENAWYLSIGGFLSASGVPWAWTAAWALVAFDLADNLAYLFAARTGVGNLDEIHPFLSAFRLIAGRRNIYVWMLLPGIVIGAAPTTYVLVVLWAGLTAALHWGVALGAGWWGSQTEEKFGRADSSACASAEMQMQTVPVRFPRSGSSGTRSPRSDRPVREDPAQ